MSTAKKVLLLAAVICVVVGLFLCFGVSAVMGYDYAKLNAQTAETNTYTIEEAFANLSVKAAECDVRLRPSEGDVCQVVCRESNKVSHAVYVEDDTLFIERSDSRKWYERIGIFFGWINMEITVYLPESAYASLSVVSVSGDVEIPAGFSFADAEVQSTSGDVLFLASAEGALSLKTVSGNLSVRDSAPKSLRAQSTSGDVSIASVEPEGELTVKTVSGDVTLARVVCGSLEAESTSGDVSCTNLFVSENLRIKTVSGDVDLRVCDADTLWIKTVSGDVFGNLLSEKQFVTVTSSGSVRVPSSTSGGKCEVTTTSGNIRFTVGLE